MGYIMTFDYHTHSIYSDGKGSIRDNVIAAREKGLTEIAITDHGPRQIEHGIRMDRVPEMRKEVDALNAEFEDIRVYLGVEANIVSINSCIDILPEERELFDFIIAGYHNSVPDAYSHENWNAFHRGMRSPALKVKNTEMTLTAIYENNLKILTHPGGGYHVDMAELAKACAETGTYMEINSHNRNLTVDQIRQCAKEDVKFIISSDAHLPEDIADARIGLLRAQQAGLDFERIVNIKEIPE